MDAFLFAQPANHGWRVEKYSVIWYYHNRGIEQLAARKAHNLEVPGSNPGPATKKIQIHDKAG